jgi:hypothetical protein
VAWQELLELEVSHRRPWGVRVERVPEPVAPVTADRRVDRPAPRARPAHHESEVLACQLPAPHEALEPGVRLLRAGDDEQARGVTVEAVHDSRAVLLAASGAGGGQRVCQCAAGVSRRRMNDDTRRLVDDEEMLVGVRDGEVGLGYGRLGGGRRRQLDLDLLPTYELVALAADVAVHQHGTGGEQPLGGRPRSDLRHGGEVAVEPLSRGLRRDDEPLQRLGGAPLSRVGRGSRSARTSAARRITTPITMKLSARLNAGQ